MDVIICRCRCGEVYRADRAHTGKSLRCAKCNEILLIGEVKPVPAKQGTIFVNATPRVRNVTPGAVGDKAILRIGAVVLGLIGLGVIAIFIKTVTAPIHPVATNRPPAAAPVTLEEALKAGGKTVTAVKAVPSPIVTPKAKQQSPLRTVSAVQPTPLPPPMPVLPSPSKSHASPAAWLLAPSLPPVYSAQPTRLPPPPRTLPNGTDIVTPVGTGGRGKLTATNGNLRDAFVTVGGDGVFRQTYISAGSPVTLSGIPPCTCTVLFTSGIDWDADMKRFIRNTSFTKFDEPFYFPDDRIRTYTITLNPVIGGDAKTDVISEAEYRAILASLQGERALK